MTYLNSPQSMQHGTRNFFFCRLLGGLAKILVDDILEFTAEHAAWHQELFFVDCWEVCPRCFLANDWDAIRILSQDSLCFGMPCFERSCFVLHACVHHGPFW